MNQIGKIQKENYSDTIKKIFLDPLKKIKGISEEIVALFERMMLYDPKSRCSADEALEIISKYAPNRKIIISEKENLHQENATLKKKITNLEKEVLELKKILEDMKKENGRKNEFIQQIEFAMHFKYNQRHSP